MTVIRVLDETTANKIAAGEVVERPASVIKELIENSIDASSTNIEVEIVDGGTSFIRVTDNGIGMSTADAQLAILRHATSKIRCVEDLYSIQSLGFRGEALPSIAAVSRFQLITRQSCDALATFIKVSGGSVEDIRETGAGLGTTIIVEDLFFNTPARKKFLKTISSESGHIHDVLGKIALARPDISFRLINKGRTVLATSGNGSLNDAVASLYGLPVASEILPVIYDQDGFIIRGFIGKPTVLKSSRQWQTIAVNKRIVTSRMLSKALDNAYHSLLPKTGYPFTVLHITTAPEGIDVNVHPQKSEIKFSDERAVFRAVYHAICNALTTTSSPADMAMSASPVLPSAANVIHEREITSSESYTGKTKIPQFISSEYPSYSSYEPTQSSKPMPLWHEEVLPLSVTRSRRDEQELLHGIGTQRPIEVNTTLRPLGQIEDCYIVAQGDDGLYIVDQHAAHERIIYDRLSEKAGIIPAQQLLVPLLLDMDERDIQVIIEHYSVWNALGFAIEQAGPNMIRISELPADVDAAGCADMIQEVLAALRNYREPTPGQLRHTILQTASCRAAIKAGDMLNMRQMLALLTELKNTSLPFTCPHGRPAMIRFSPEELAKMFKRT